MKFIGFDFERNPADTQFECEDSEIATARIGFIATGRDPDQFTMPQPNLEGTAIGRSTAENIVGGNVALIQALGTVGLSKECEALGVAVVSGIGALEEAAIAAEKRSRRGL